jgi:hypothetical protein
VVGFSGFFWRILAEIFFFQKNFFLPPFWREMNNFEKKNSLTKNFFSKFFLERAHFFSFHIFFQIFFDFYTIRHVPPTWVLLDDGFGRFLDGFCPIRPDPPGKTSKTYPLGGRILV